MKKIKQLCSSAYFLLPIASLLWAGNFVVGRALRSDISSLGLAFWRWALAFCLVIPFTYKEAIRAFPVVKKNIIVLISLSFFGISTFNTLVYTGLHSTTAINGLLINANTPGIILILGAIFFHNKLRLRGFIGVLISFIGVLTVLTKGHLGILFSLDFGIGDLFFIGACLSWSLYSLLLPRAPKMSGLVYLTYIFFFGSLILLPIYFFNSQNIFLDLQKIPRFPLLYIVIFPSFFSFLFWKNGVQQIGAAKAAPFLHLMTIFGSILSVIFLNEQLAWFHIIGFILIVSGISFSSSIAHKS